MEQFSCTILVRFFNNSEFSWKHFLITAGGKLRHLIRPKINSLRKALEFLQYGSPLNVIEIHIFNIPYFMDLVYSKFWPLYISLWG